MIRWDRNKHEINNGYEFEPGDDANVEQINGTINNALYAVDVADGLIEAPVVENPNPEEAPTVSFVDYQKDIDGVMKTVKKFKFTNIKGKRGEKGEKGDKGDSAVSFQVGSVVTLPAGSNAVVTNVGTNQDVVLDLGIPKGDKGDQSYEIDEFTRKDSRNLVYSGGLDYQFSQKASVPISLFNTIRPIILNANEIYDLNYFSELFQDRSPLRYIRLDIENAVEKGKRPLQDIGYKYFDSRKSVSGLTFPDIEINFANFSNMSKDLGAEVNFEFSYRYSTSKKEFELRLQNLSGVKIPATIYLS